MTNAKRILAVFPEREARLLESALNVSELRIYEIRLIAGRQIFLNTSGGIRFVTGRGSLSETPDPFAGTVAAGTLREIVDRATGYSAYVHAETLKEGFVTYPGGFRIGIAPAEKGAIGSLNIRLPASGVRVENPELDRVLLRPAGGLLIAGGPASGKTTLLRYAAKRLAEGSSDGFRRVAVIDERGELSGGGAFDLGLCTDVIGGMKKSEAIMTALRLFSPEFIVCDEIGGTEETEGILQGLNSGAVFAASIHAGSPEQLIRRPQFRRLFEEGVFETVLFLSRREKGKTEAVYSYRAVRDEIRGYYGAFAVGGADRGAIGLGHARAADGAG